MCEEYDDFQHGLVLKQTRDDIEVSSTAYPTWRDFYFCRGDREDQFLHRSKGFDVQPELYFLCKR